jgi:peptide/nickel transport system substrate-binding protein
MVRILPTARASAVIAVVAASALALSGCTGSATGAGDTSRLTIAIESDMATKGYDPIVGSVNQRIFWEGIYQSLFAIDENGEVAPQLVTAFTFNDDSTELTLDLDTSATFSDGSTLDAELVKANLDARGDAELQAYDQFNVGQENEITAVTVVDDDTVTLSFAQPRPGFEANLVAPSGIIVGPTGAADRESLATAPDGSGPLTIDLDETVKGNRYVQV